MDEEVSACEALFMTVVLTGCRAGVASVSSSESLVGVSSIASAGIFRPLLDFGITGESEKANRSITMKHRWRHKSRDLSR